jgi:hypothetical protein
VEILSFLLVWFGLSIGAAVIAGNKGRSAIGFFLLSFLLSPLIGFVAALLASENHDFVERRKFANVGGSKRCLFCASWISRQASVCPQCAREQQVIPKPGARYCMHCGVQLGPGDAFCAACGTITERSASAAKSNLESQHQLPDSPPALPAARPSSQGTASADRAGRPRVELRQGQARITSDTATKVALGLAAAFVLLMIIAAVTGSKLPSESTKPAATEQTVSEIPNWLKRDLAAIDGGLSSRVAGKRIAKLRSQGTGSEVDPYSKLAVIHGNIILLRATVQTALENLDKNQLPAWVRDRTPPYREGLLDIRGGADMQLAFWDDGDDSVITPGDEKIEAGVNKLIKFAESLGPTHKGKPKSSRTPKTNL